jgi:transposase-like protein
MIREKEERKSSKNQPKMSYRDQARRAADAAKEVELLAIANSPHRRSYLRLRNTNQGTPLPTRDRPIEFE